MIIIHAYRIPIETVIALVARSVGLDVKIALDMSLDDFTWAVAAFRARQQMRATN